MAQVRGRKRTMGLRGSVKQKKELICHLEKDIAFAQHQFTSEDERNEFNKRWDDLAVKLNALGGARKTGIGWKKYWYDLRTRVSKRCTTIKAKWAKSGRKEDIVIVFDDLEQRILSIMRTDSVDGEDIELVAKPNSPAESTYTIVYEATSGGEDINDEIIVSESASTKHLQKDLKRKKEVDGESEYYKKLLKLKEEKLNLLREDCERKRRKEQRQIEKHDIEMEILKKKTG